MKTYQQNDTRVMLVCFIGMGIGLILAIWGTLL